MNATELRTFPNKWLASWTGNNPKLLLGYYTNDAYYLDPANPEGLKGKESISEYFTKLLRKNPDWKWSVVETFTTETGFTLKWKAEIPIPNTNLILFGLDIVELSGNKISRNEVYFDRSIWMNELMKKL